MGKIKFERDYFNRKTFIFIQSPPIRVSILTDIAHVLKNRFHCSKAVTFCNSEI